MNFTNIYTKFRHFYGNLAVNEEKRESDTASHHLLPNSNQPDSLPSISNRAQIIQKSEEELLANYNYQIITSLIEQNASKSSETPAKRIDLAFKAIQAYIDEHLFLIEDRCDLLDLLLCESGLFKEKLTTLIGERARSLINRQFDFNLLDLINESLFIFEAIDFIRFIESITKSNRLTHAVKSKIKNDLLVKLYHRLMENDEAFSFKELFTFVQAFKGHQLQNGMQHKAAHIRLTQFIECHVKDSDQFNLGVFESLLKDLHVLLGSIDMSTEKSKLLNEEKAQLNSQASAVSEKAKQIFQTEDPLAIDFSTAYSTSEEESEEEITDPKDHSVEIFKMLRDNFEMIAAGDFLKCFPLIELTRLKPSYDKLAHILALDPLHIENDINNDFLKALFIQLKEKLSGQPDDMEMLDLTDANEEEQLAAALSLSMQEPDLSILDLFEKLVDEIPTDLKYNRNISDLIITIRYAIQFDNTSAAGDLLNELSNSLIPS